MNNYYPLEENVYKIEQTVTAVLYNVLNIEDKSFKVRFTVESDSYLFQCKATAEVFNPDTLEWNHIYNIHPDGMATPKGLCYKWGDEGTDMKNFEKDVVTLKEMVKKILA